jgi:hypothetical protein
MAYNLGDQSVGGLIKLLLREELAVFNMQQQGCYVATWHVLQNPQPPAAAPRNRFWLNTRVL